MDTVYLGIGDYLLIAEAVTGTPAEKLAHLDRMRLADSALHVPESEFEGHEAYPDFAAKAAALTWHLVKNHPLPDGNKRAAFLSLLEFVMVNGRRWERHPDDPHETDAVIRGVAEGSVSKEQLRDWIAERVITG